MSKGIKITITMLLTIRIISHSIRIRVKKTFDNISYHSTYSITNFILELWEYDK